MAVPQDTDTLTASTVAAAETQKVSETCAYVKG